MRRRVAFVHYAITDRAAGDVVPRLGEFAPGTLAVQLRDKALPPDERAREAERLREATAAAGHLLLIGGGDEALARAVGADGVHVPAAAPPPDAPDLLVGRSCHDAVELAAARDAAVDFVTLSPVLASPGKGAPLGWDRFEELAAAFPGPVFALGGVGPADLDEARRRGAGGVAGIRAYARGGDLTRT